MPEEAADSYHPDAEKFAARYESKPFEEFHSEALGLIPNSNPNSLILDIGAGSGRDACSWKQPRRVNFRLSHLNSCNMDSDHSNLK